MTESIMSGLDSKCHRLVRGIGAGLALPSLFRILEPQHA